MAWGNEVKGSVLKGNKFNEEKMVPNSVLGVALNKGKPTKHTAW